MVATKREECNNCGTNRLQANKNLYHAKAICFVNWLSIFNVERDATPLTLYGRSFKQKSSVRPRASEQKELCQ